MPEGEKGRFSENPSQEGVDKERLGAWLKMAENLEKGRENIESLKKTTALDDKRIAWWKQMAKKA